MDRLPPEDRAFDRYAGLDDELLLDEEEHAAPELPPSPVGTDDRRLQVRAYSYWASLLGNRSLPCTDDLDLGAVDDFATNSVVLEFGDDTLNPQVRHLGSLLARESGGGDAIETIADVPSRSLLSRITTHYMQILANRAPIGFEAEFVDAAGHPIMYRGILMPFSRDDDRIDTILGVINWKEALPEDEAHALETELRGELDRTRQVKERGTKLPVNTWADGPAGEPESADTRPVEDTPAGDLRHCIASARALATHAAGCEDRSHAALYDAIGRAYDASLAAAREPELFATLLEERGLKRQKRAPMTPIVKLVFGPNHDKRRITEYAAALSYAQRLEMAPGGLADHLRTIEGGLKAVVREERNLRRADREPVSTRRGDAPRLPRSLRDAKGRALETLAEGETGWGLVLIRREAAGAVTVLGELNRDHPLLERAARRIAAEG